jgi:hypothetical protein
MVEVPGNISGKCVGLGVMKTSLDRSKFELFRDLFVKILL